MSPTGSQHRFSGAGFRRHMSIIMMAIVAALLLTSTSIQADTFPAQSESEYTLATFTLSNIARANFGFYSSAIARKGGARNGCGARTSNQAPLEWSNALANAARSHSNDMLANGCFSHSACACSGAGCDFASRIQSFYGVAAIAENIANGQTDALSLVDDWMASDGHCQNVRNTGFRQMGVSANSKATQTFGGRGGAAAGTLISGILFGGNFVAVAAAGTSSVRVWVGNEAREMAHVGGGIFQAPGAGVGSCVPYFFEVGSSGRSLFPAGPSGVLQANCNVLFSGAAKGNSSPSLGSSPAPAATSTETDSPSTTATPDTGNATAAIPVAVPRKTPAVPRVATDDATVSEGKQSEDKDSNAAPGISIGTGIAAFSVLLVAAGFVMRKAHQRGYGFSDVFPPNGSQQPDTMTRGQFETYLGSTKNHASTANVRSYRGPQRLPIPAGLAGQTRPPTMVEIQGVPAEEDRVLRALEARADRQQKHQLQQQQQQQQHRQHQRQKKHQHQAKRSKHQVKSSLDSVDRMMAPTLDCEPSTTNAATARLDVPSMTTRHRHASPRPIEHVLEVEPHRPDGASVAVRPLTMVVDQDMGDMDNSSYLFSEHSASGFSRPAITMRQERTVSFVESEDGVEDGREVMEDIVARTNLSTIEIDTHRSVSSSSNSRGIRRPSKTDVPPILTASARRQGPSGSIPGSRKK